MWVPCGIEIEIVKPRELAGEALRVALPDRWRYDASDVEVVSHILLSRAEAETKIAAACSALRRLGCTVGQPGRGLHVHLSRAALTPAGCARLIRRYYAHLPELNERWPSRARHLQPGCGLTTTGRICEYCRPACGPHRTLPTIEVRQAPATLCHSAILGWVDQLVGWSLPDAPPDSQSTAWVKPSTVSPGKFEGFHHSDGTCVAHEWFHAESAAVEWALGWTRHVTVGYPGRPGCYRLR